MAFLRRETQTPNLTYKSLVKEPLVVVLPIGHRLAGSKTIHPQELTREIYIAQPRSRRR